MLCPMTARSKVNELQHLKEDRVLKISRVYNYSSLKPACMSGSGTELPARSHREGVELDMPRSFPLCKEVTLLLTLQGLRKQADEPEFQKKWQHVKQVAKEKAVAKLKELTGVQARPDAIMDVQVRCSSLHAASFAAK